MANPSVSIGMPVYNAEAFLSETLRSLQNQTFKDLEIIISDNASTDSTEAICRRVAAEDDRVRYIRNKSNLGIVPNFNRAFELSSAKYFRWCAFDDPIEPAYVERCVEILDADPSVVLVAPRTSLIESNGDAVPFRPHIHAFVTSYGEVIPATTPPGDAGSKDVIRRFRSALFELGGSNHAQFFYGLMRSDALRRTSLMGRYVGAERVMLAELALMGRMVEVREKMFNRRHHPGHFGNLTPRETAKRMNPNQSLFLFPSGRQAVEYLKAVARSDAATRQKLACSFAVGEKLLQAGIRRTSHRLRKSKSSGQAPVGVPR